MTEVMEVVTVTEQVEVHSERYILAKDGFHPLLSSAS